MLFPSDLQDLQGSQAPCPSGSAYSSPLAAVRVPVSSLRLPVSSDRPYGEDTVSGDQPFSLNSTSARCPAAAKDCPCLASTSFSEAPPTHTLTISLSTYLSAAVTRPTLISFFQASGLGRAFSSLFPAARPSNPFSSEPAANTSHQLSLLLAFQRSLPPPHRLGCAALVCLCMSTLTTGDRAPSIPSHLSSRLPGCSNKSFQPFKQDASPGG